MKWNEYQQGALSTAVYPLERELDYTILGLCSEVAEIADWLGEDYLKNDVWAKGMKAEVGDCYWYVAAIADALKLPLEDVATGAARWHYVSSLESVYLYLVTDTGYMAGLLKKAIRDDDGYLGEQKLERMVSTLGRVCWILDNLCAALNTSRHAVMSENLNKLADRKARGVLAGSGDNR